VNSTQLNDELVHFIARYIVSVEKLEILLLLEEGAGRSWTPAEVYAVLRSNVTSIQRWMKELHADGFLQQEETEAQYRYAPRTAGLAEGATALKNAYRERPIRVIEAIFSKSTEQMRRFSDAFRLRKDP
jgi:DNA-binding IclR family transcriptional regulator